MNAATAGDDEVGKAVQSAIAQVGDSTVRIRIIGSAGGDDLAVSSQVTTGVVVSDAGEILTSLFGFSGQPAAIFVEDLDGERVAAEVVATDYLKKLVLLKCDGGRFKPAAFADSLWPDVGAYSVAAGRLYPGPIPSASLGIVSAVARVNGMAIQTDAKISPVNYGGPLVDLQGRVLGVLVPLSPRDTGDDIGAGVEWYDSGIGFAIPAVDALQAVEKLRTGKDLLAGVVGVRLSTKNSLAEKFHVVEVSDNSPAAVAGLKANDLVVAANGIQIDRFGVLESIIKGSYAGDRLMLRIRRGDDEFEAELRLADKVVRPVAGYLGLIISDVATTGDKVIGVNAFVMPDSPASLAGAPESIVVTELNGQTISSVEQLSKLLRETVVGKDSQLVYQLPGAEDNSTKLTVVSAARAVSVLDLPSAIVESIYRTEDSARTNWQRQQKDLPDAAGKIWYFADSNSQDSPCGLAVLLSESQTAPEVLLRKWEPVCRLHNMAIVVVQNKEGTALSREDSALVPQAVAAVGQSYKLDADRIVLVSEKAQVELATELLLNPRLRVFRSAAFNEASPRFTGVPDEILAAKTKSVLLLAGQVQSRQSQALMIQAGRELVDSGASVVQHRIDDAATDAGAIANWAVSLKAR